MTDRFALAIHGGAGTLAPEIMSDRVADSLHEGMRAALLAGHRVLAKGGAAVDAVVAAVCVLEHDTQFNAGRGAVFNASGAIEMDAALMDGATGRAGAVAAISGPRNPIQAARAVMEHSPHVLLAGDGALEFLRGQGLPFEDADYFHTERRWRALQTKLTHQKAGDIAPLDDADRHGTVGAVAIDSTGGLAAATSTGGMTAKLPGRVGDTPLLGAGTWATATCAVSATGDGEHFMRIGAGHEICARMRLGGQSAAEAAEGVLAEIGARGGSGGVIVADAAGRIAMPFNSRGMYRGTVDADGHGHTAIYRDGLRALDPAAFR